MTDWDIDPEERVLGRRPVAPREHEHPYDTKRREDARIMAAYEAAHPEESGSAS